MPVKCYFHTVMALDAVGHQVIDVAEDGLEVTPDQKTLTNEQHDLIWRIAEELLDGVPEGEYQMRNDLDELVFVCRDHLIHHAISYAEDI